MTRRTVPFCRWGSEGFAASLYQCGFGHLRGKAGHRRRGGLREKGSGPGTTSAHQAPFVGCAPICRHHSGRQRRKLSIIPPPVDGRFPFPAWSILSTTPSRPPWRSTAVPSLPLPSPPVARLRRTFCLPLRRRIRRPSSPITFKTPAMVAHLTLMLSPSSREEIYWRKTPLLDRFRGPFQFDISVGSDLRYYTGGGEVDL